MQPVISDVDNWLIDSGEKTKDITP